MWKIIQELLPAVLVILFITQLVIPVLLNKRTWWLFRGETDDDKEIKEKPTAKPSQLMEEIEATKVVVEEAKAKAEVVKEKAEGNLKEAEDLKKAADKLK